MKTSYEWLTLHVFIIPSLNLKFLLSVKPFERHVNRYTWHIYIIAETPLMETYRSRGETFCFLVEGVSQHTKHMDPLLLPVLIEVRGHLIKNWVEDIIPSREDYHQTQFHLDIFHHGAHLLCAGHGRDWWVMDGDQIMLVCIPTTSQAPVVGHVQIQSREVCIMVLHWWDASQDW